MGNFDPQQIVALQEVGSNNLIPAEFFGRILADDVSYVEEKSHHSDVAQNILAEGLQFRRSTATAWMQTYLYTFEDTTYVMISRHTNDDFVGIAVASNDQAAVTKVHEMLAPRCVSPVIPDNKIAVNFWFDTPNGPMFRRRNIVTEEWDEIASNYTAAARSQIAQLMARTSGASHEGKLVLLHGKPGTGKTTVIRALTKAWRPWCSFSYILDPERAFGEAHYLLKVALDQAGEDPDDLDDEEVPKGPRWHLLIIEDANELISSTAQAKSGQAMSRLLNLSDGIIGQGLRTMVLITTNEPMIKLHEAVARPGRCMADIEFAGLSAAEANAWLASHHIDKQVSSGQPLAELYEELRNTHIRVEAAPESAGNYI